MNATQFTIVFEAEPTYLELCNTEFTTDTDSFDTDAIEFVAETVEGFTRDDNEEYSQVVTAVEGDDETGVQPGDVMVCSGYGCNVYFVRQATASTADLVKIGEFGFSDGTTGTVWAKPENVTAVRAEWNEIDEDDASRAAIQPAIAVGGIWIPDAK